MHALRADPDLLVELLDVSAQSLVQFALDSVAALREATVAADSGSADADAITMIQLIANGPQVTEDIAQTRLRYRPSRPHVALVLWVDDPDQADELDAVIAQVRARVETRTVLVVAASATARWVLVDALTQDRQTARRFVTRTLGQLAEADTELRQTLLTCLQCGFNTTRAAAQLYAHRNTVERRVSRASGLSAVSIEDNPMQVAAALSLLELAPTVLDG